MMSTVSVKDNELHEDNKIFQNADSLPKQNSHVMQLSVNSSTDSSRDLPPVPLSAEKSFRNIMEMMNNMKDYQDTDTSAKDVETSEMVSYPLGETSTILSSVLSSMAEMAIIDDTEFDKDKKKTCRFNTNIDTNPGGERQACTDAAELEDKEGRSLQRTNDKVNGKNEKSYDCSYQKDGGGYINDENSKNSWSKNGMKVNICQLSHACEQQGVRNDNLFIGQTKEQSRDRRVEYCFTNCADKAPKVGENTYTCVDHCHPCIEAGGNLNMPVQPPYYQPYVNVVPFCCPLQSHGTINTQLTCNKNRYHKMHVRHTPISSAMKCTKTRRGPKRFYRHLMRLPRRKKNYGGGGHSLTSQCIGHRDVQPPPCSGIVKRNCDEFVCEPLRERVDIYYFDHGNSGYYRTTDRPPTTKADLVLEDTEEYVTKFWADVFGYIHIAFAFIIHFLLQLLRFLLLAIVRPLTVGAIQLGSDYFFKPLLSIAFNGVLQPVLILAYNVATSVKDLCQPLARAVGYFLRELAVVVRSLRLVEVHSYKQQRCV